MRRTFDKFPIKVSVALIFPEICHVRKRLIVSVQFENSTTLTKIFQCHLPGEAADFVLNELKVNICIYIVQILKHIEIIKIKVK